MPLVIVRYQSRLRPEEDEDVETRAHYEESFFNPLREGLPAIVAKALDTPDNPDGRLEAGDIAVSFQSVGEFDCNTIPLSITIFANDYPERRANLTERKEQIIREVSRITDTTWVTFSVWVLLAPGAYGMLLSANDNHRRIEEVVSRLMGVESWKISNATVLTGDLQAIAREVAAKTGLEITLSPGATFRDLLHQTETEF